MTQIQAYESMSKEALIEHHKHTLQQHADDMDMLSKELAERPHAKIDRPMAIGCGRFGVGIKASTVLDAAARHYDFVTNEKREQDRIELGKLRADNFLKHGAPTDLEMYKAWLEKVSSPTPAAPTVPAETLRVCSVIANKIEEGALSHVGFYSNTALSEFIRQLMRAVSMQELTPEPLREVRPARIPTRFPQKRACGNPQCTFEGYTDRLCGSVGPLCPECGETTEPICSCPSGDGSLRWPCPVHPPC